MEFSHEYLSQLLERVRTWHGQPAVDGPANAWIVKPSGKSRGRGICCFDSLSAILAYTQVHVYTFRFVYIHSGSYIYIQVHIYTFRFVYIHSGTYTYTHSGIYIYTQVPSTLLSICLVSRSVPLLRIYSVSHSAL